MEEIPAALLLEPVAPRILTEARAQRLEELKQRLEELQAKARAKERRKGGGRSTLFNTSSEVYNVYAADPRPTAVVAKPAVPAPKRLGPPPKGLLRTGTGAARELSEKRGKREPPQELLEEDAELAALYQEVGLSRGGRGVCRPGRQRTCTSAGPAAQGPCLRFPAPAPPGGRGPVHGALTAWSASGGREPLDKARSRQLVTL